MTDTDLITILLMVLIVIIEISLRSPFITQENEDDRLAFLCETDLGGRQVPPGTWSEALEILQNNYANSLVIQALADALHYKLVIITVHGVNKLILLLYLRQYKTYRAEAVVNGHLGNSKKCRYLAGGFRE